MKAEEYRAALKEDIVDSEVKYLTGLSMKALVPAKTEHQYPLFRLGNERKECGK